MPAPMSRPSAMTKSQSTIVFRSMREVRAYLGLPGGREHELESVRVAQSEGARTARIERRIVEHAAPRDDTGCQRIDVLRRRELDREALALHSFGAERAGVLREEELDRTCAERDGDERTARRILAGDGEADHVAVPGDARFERCDGERDAERLRFEGWDGGR